MTLSSTGLAPAPHPNDEPLSHDEPSERRPVTYGWLDLHLDPSTNATLLRTLHHGTDLPNAGESLRIALHNGRLHIDGRPFRESHPHPTAEPSALAVVEAAYRHLHHRIQAGADEDGWLRLHAAAVEHDGARILLAAPSGTGKTTLALHLALRHGWRLLGDEAVHVRNGLTAPLPRRLHIRRGTIRLLPELADVPDPVLLPYWPPLLTLDPARLRPDRRHTLDHAPASHIVLLQADHAASRSTLTPLPVPELLAALTAEALPYTQHHGNAVAQLAALMRQTPAHRLHLGDLDQAADLLHGLA